MEKIRYLKNGQEIIENYSNSLARQLLDLDIDYEVFDDGIEVEEVVMSDRRDRQFKVVPRPSEWFEELLAKGWYVVEHMTPDDIPWDDPPL